MSTGNIHPLLDVPMQLGESPIWHAGEQALYWIDIPAHEVHRFATAEAAHRTWQLPSEPGCIAFTDSGPLLVAMRSGVALLDLHTGSLEPHAAPPYDPARSRFNDGRCDSHGRFWLGSLYDPRDRPGGSLYCLERGKLLDLGKPVTVSNGVAFSPDNRTLYHTDTTAHRICAYAFDAETGAVSQAHTLRTFSTERGPQYGGRPDGAAVDVEGAYWVAMYEGAQVLRLSPQGEILRSIPLPVRCPTMVAFGGRSLSTLFITSARHNRPQSELDQLPLSGHVLRLDVEVPGMPEHVYRL